MFRILLVLSLLSVGTGAWGAAVPGMEGQAPLVLQLQSYAKGGGQEPRCFDLALENGNGSAGLNWLDHPLVSGLEEVLDRVRFSLDGEEPGVPLFSFQLCLDW
ncbi:hypothetical protein DESUT3_34260 [Desulfuromonas versatilis]|uniref:Uncharacterized protein n=1 Tax=Desulfuromonas versatilis TaxID=2802975 RepID=A0ABN6E1Z1_9BACT|nr:hypothetical protein [Desulfuromonas versatilis]BCR06357.1 hypothetical protein DESUT3_34260 [Desulfuromonas versatilis]